MMRVSVVAIVIIIHISTLFSEEDPCVLALAIIIIIIIYFKYVHQKKFQVEKRGKRSWVLIRQAPHDPQYKLGSHIPSYGKVIAVDNECAFCGESYDDHRAATDLSAPFCMAPASRYGDRFIRGTRQCQARSHSSDQHRLGRAVQRGRRQRSASCSIPTPSTTAFTAAAPAATVVQQIRSQWPLCLVEVQ